MLISNKLTLQSAEYREVQDLYLQSFPENEREPLELLLDDSSDCSEVFSFYDNEVFCGFVCLLTYWDISHILYFAIVDNLRDKGYGGEVLQLLKHVKPQYRIIADIEDITSKSTNNAQREKRKKFYLRNGFVASGVKYDWRHESYEIMIEGGDITRRELKDFWRVVGKVNSNFKKF